LFVCLFQAAKAENKRLHTEQRLLHRQACQPPARPPTGARARAPPRRCRQTEALGPRPAAHGPAAC
jgi:hypothetical protein